MLVLARKPGERICISDGIEIVVLEIRGNRVRLGIEAPRSVDVRRCELNQRHSLNQEHSVRFPQDDRDKTVPST